MAADRGAFIDQSQSLNLFIESPNIGQLSSMYFYAWKRGLKLRVSSPVTVTGSRRIRTAFPGPAWAPGRQRRADISKVGR